MSKNLNSISNKKRTTAEKPDDEVEELLKAAQDDVLLKLSLNSHIAHSSSQNFTIHPDLDTRFQALKSKKRPNPKLARKKNPEPEPEEVGVNEQAVEIDDLFARFSALKTSLSSSSSQSPAAQNQSRQLPTEDDEDDEEDEVEKILRWAKDAARLDPSPPSDIEQDEDHSDKDSDEELAASKTSKRK